MSSEAQAMPGPQRPAERVLDAIVRRVARVCPLCGTAFPPSRPHQVYCCDGHRIEAWTARQAALDFTPAPAPVPPVVDQRVPKSETQTLCRMSRAILERLRQGPATASELQGMFPGARSVRTRISDVGRWLGGNGERLHSEPVRGVVGEWIYRIERG